MHGINEMAEYWIQLHDYSRTEYKNASPNETKNAFRTFNWDSELASFDENDPERNCPPGFGISNGIPLTEDGAILLHVCPLDSGSVFLNIHCSRIGQMFGIFPKVKQATKCIDSIERSRVDGLIDLVFSGESEALLAAE